MLTATEKFSRSLNETATTDLQTEVQKIRDLCASIARDAHARGLAENRETRLIVEDSAADTKKIHVATGEISKVTQETHNMQQATIRGLTEVALPLSQAHLKLANSLQRMERERRDDKQRHEEEMKEHKEMLRELRETQRSLGILLADSLRDQALQHIDSAAARTEQDILRSGNGVVPLRQRAASQARPALSRSRSSSTTSEPEFETVMLDDVLEYSREMEFFIVGMDNNRLANLKPAKFGSKTLVCRLQDWSSATESELLWVCGPPTSGTPSNMIGAAVSILQNAQILGIPIIAHACERGRPTVGSGESREEIGLIGLLYSLIRQLLTFLPPETSGKIDLSRTRFRELDGSAESWEDALELFAELLDAAPPLLIIAIDNLGRLDHGAAVKQCEQLLNVLDEGMATVPPTQKVVKLLLTTSGAAKSLRSAIPRSDMCVVEEKVGKRQDSKSLDDGEMRLNLQNMHVGNDDISRTHSGTSGCWQ
jgi:hypothetical protein